MEWTDTFVRDLFDNSSSPQLYVVPYNSSRESLGGASFIDVRLLNGISKEGRDTLQFSVTDDARDSVPLSVQGSKVLLARTMIRMLLLGEPYQIAKFRQSRHWKKTITGLQSASEGRSRVICSGWPSLLLALDAGIKPDLYIAHNIEASIAEAYSPRVLRCLRDPARFRHAEVKSLRGAGQIMCLSKADAESLLSLGFEASTVEIPLVQRRKQASGGKGLPMQVGFLGKMSWPPNAMAYGVLVDQVLPLVNRSSTGPLVEVVVAGVGSELLPARPHVRRIGPVQELSDFYSQVDVVAVPRLGPRTGVSVKLLEAVEWGIPAVTPRTLAEDAGLMGMVIVADSVEEMADALLVLARELGRGKLGADS